MTTDLLTDPCERCPTWTHTRQPCCDCPRRHRSMPSHLHGPMAALFRQVAGAARLGQPMPPAPLPSPVL